MGPPGEPGSVNGGRMAYDAGSDTLTVYTSAFSVRGPDGAPLLLCDQTGCLVPNQLRAGRPGLGAALTDYAVTVDQAGARFTVPVTVGPGGIWNGEHRALLESDALVVRPVQSADRPECGARFLAKYTGTCVGGGDPDSVLPTPVTFRRAA